MNVREGRSEIRYSLLRRIDGMLGNVEIVLLDIGERGVHVSHESPMRLGSAETMSFAVSDCNLSVRLPSFVVWSRFTASSDARPYRSGLRADDPGGLLKGAIERLLEIRSIRIDEESMERKKKVLEDRAQTKRSPRMKYTVQPPRIPDDVILLVKQTRLRLQDNPAEIVRWYNRAKYSLNEAGEQIHERDDVLAVWEYLERSVELSIISRILGSTT